MRKQRKHKREKQEKEKREGGSIRRREKTDRHEVRRIEGEGR